MSHVLLTEYGDHYICGLMPCSGGRVRSATARSGGASACSVVKRGPAIPTESTADAHRFSGLLGGVDCPLNGPDFRLSRWAAQRCQIVRSAACRGGASILPDVMRAPYSVKMTSTDSAFNHCRA
ncbi:hypothetical protein IF2G_05711 [Cordyceps javanica]|nr:hypothetical protein IF2G_05711 [Cordyceps javanica]